MHRAVTIIIAMILFFPNDDAFAEKWSFEHIVHEACVTYPSVLSKKSSRDAAIADVNSAEWERFPAPSVETMSDRNGNYTFAVRIQQILWAGGRISSGIDSARFLRDASEKAIRETQYDVVAKVIDSYIEAMRQQSRKTISQHNLEQHEQLDDTIKRRVASDVSPDVDRQLSQSRLSQAINDRAVVDQALAKSMSWLAQLSGNNVTEVTPVNVASISLPDNRDAAIRQAIDWSPTLSRLAFEEAAAESQIQIKKAVYWPTVSLRYEKNLNNNSSYYGTASDDRIMLVLDAQPGAGLSAFSGVEGAVARKRAAQEERNGVLRDLQRLVSDVWNDLEVARRQLANASAAQSSAENVSESYKRQYIIGRKTWLEVLNAVREATQSEFSVVDAKAQVAVSTLRIALLTGKIPMDITK